MTAQEMSAKKLFAVTAQLMPLLDLDGPFGALCHLEAGTRKTPKIFSRLSKQVLNCTLKFFLHKFAFVILFRAIHLAYYAFFYQLHSLLQALYPITVSNRRMPYAWPHHLNSCQCFVRAIPSQEPIERFDSFAHPEHARGKAYTTSGTLGLHLHQSGIHLAGFLIVLYCKMKTQSLHCIYLAA